MEDLSLHIMDIVENSITGGAANVVIRAFEQNGRLVISIVDDGVGMSPDQIRRASDPFYTTKPGKKYGLGLALFKQAAEQTGGSFSIDGAENGGTEVRAEFIADHPDMQPVGDLEGTVSLLQRFHPDVTFTLEHESITSRGGAR